MVPSLNSSAVWPAVSSESSRTRFGQAEGVGDVDRAGESLHAQRRGTLPPSVTVSVPSWPLMLSVLSPVANTWVSSSPVPVLRVVG